MNSSQQIIAAALGTVRLPGPWRLLRACDNFRSLDNSAGLLDRLLGERPVEDLLDAGVIRGQQGSWTLHPVLANDPKHLFATTIVDDRRAMVLANATHCLGAEQPAWLTLLKTAVTGPLQKFSQPLLFARSMEDACILWSAGLFATVAPAAHLTCRSLSAIKSLTKSAESHRGYEDTVIVVDWSVAPCSLQNNPLSDSLLYQLQGVQELTDSTFTLKRWQPSTTELAKLSFTLRFRDLALTAQALRDSLAAATTIKPRVPVEPVPRFDIERERYIDAVGRRSSDTRKIRQALYTALDSRFAEPLRKSTSKSNDPAEQAIIALAIEGFKQVEVELLELAARPSLTSELAHADPLGHVLKHAEQVRRLLSGSNRKNSSSGAWGQIK